MPEIDGDSEEELEGDQGLPNNQSGGTLDTDAARINADVADQSALASNVRRGLFTQARTGDQNDESKMSAEQDENRPC